MKRTITLLGLIFCINGAILAQQNIGIRENTSNILTIKEKKMMVKLGGIFIPVSGTSLGAYDCGFEYKFHSHLTFEISYSHSFKSSDDGEKSKSVWTPQLRYYFLKDRWQSSPFIGIMAQKHLQSESFSNVTRPGGTTVELDKWGTGLILGSHIKFNKTFGLDIHIGDIWEKGNVKNTKEEIGSITSTTENKSNFRLLGGLNLYIAF